MNSVERAIAQAKAEGFSLHQDSACLVCGTPIKPNIIGHAKEHEYKNTTKILFPVIRCEKCNLVSLFPRPDEREMDRIYPQDYYSFNVASKHSNKNLSLVQQIQNKLWAKRLSSQLSPILKHCFQKGPDRILDIGCGVGVLLDIAKTVYPRAETWGIDFGEKAIEIAKQSGHKAFAGRFEDINFGNSLFDVILSRHVIEHVGRPDLFLQSCRELLSSNGVILIETPNTNSLLFNAFKKQHSGIYHAPRHWHLFEKSTFEKLADKLDLIIVGFGLYPVGVFWVWTLHSWFSEKFSPTLADKLFPPVKIMYGGIYSVLLMGTFQMLESFLGLFGIESSAMWIAFQKKPQAQK